MLLRLLLWAATMGLVGAVSWPRDLGDDPVDDSLMGYLAGIAVGLGAGGACEYLHVRRQRVSEVSRSK